MTIGTGKVEVIHSLVQKDGKYIVLPVWVSGDTKYGNLAHPNPHANSSVGDVQQGYPHGTKFVDGDRRFYYGYCYSVYEANKANYGMFNLNEQDTCNFSATAGVAGDTIVGVVASTLDVDTTPDEDDFAGGWFLPRTNPYSSFRVLHSTTYTGGRTNGEVDLTLDYGLVEAVTASVASCYLNRSEFTKMGSKWSQTADFATCPGVTLIDPIASTWQWVQSWGPCYVVAYNEEIGATVNTHQCVFHDDGSIRKHSGSTDRQLAGYMYPSSSASYSSTWLIRLQINF